MGVTRPKAIVAMVCALLGVFLWMGCGSGPGSDAEDVHLTLLIDTSGPVVYSGSYKVDGEETEIARSRDDATYDIAAKRGQTIRVNVARLDANRPRYNARGKEIVSRLTVRLLHEGKTVRVQSADAGQSGVGFRFDTDDL